MLVVITCLLAKATPVKGEASHIEIENTIKATPVVVQASAGEPPKPEVPQPIEVPTCQSEIAKYDWNQSVALAVAYAESKFDPNVVNDNPRTRDYSIGCFQVNLYGANARTRPSEAELKNPVINVQWAYKIYAANGNSFLGHWGVCRRGVACY